MASTQNVILLPSTAITADGTTSGSTIELPSFAQDFIATCEVSGRTDGTYTLTVQHSPDNVNWFTLDAVAAISSNIMAIKAVSGSSFVFVRASLLAASVTTGATVKCMLHFGSSK